jgi:hypothetical protein
VKVKAKIEIKQMWKDGPFRQTAQERPGASWVRTDTIHKYLGSYVCAECRQPRQQGVRLAGNGKWLCARCEKAQRPTKPSKIAKSIEREGKE